MKDKHFLFITVFCLMQNVFADEHTFPLKIFTPEKCYETKSTLAIKSMILNNYHVNMVDIKSIGELPSQTLSFLEKLKCSPHKMIFLKKDDSDLKVDGFLLISCIDCKGFLIPLRISLDNVTMSYFPQFGLDDDYSLIQFISTCGINLCINQHHERKETSSNINDFIKLYHDKNNVFLSCKITESQKFLLEKIEFLQYGDTYTSFKLLDNNTLYIIKNPQNENLLVRYVYIIDKDKKIIDSYNNIVSKQLQILLP